MRLLIIGGTRFVGRHLVTAALERGHEVTLFNRGTQSSALPEVETIRGDRNKDLDKLQGRRWDAVVDTCGYLPRNVKATTETLSQSVERYVFISSQSAYADVSVGGVDESAPLKSLTSEQLDSAYQIDTSGEPSYGQLYGGLKALCEQAAEEAMPRRVLIVRPGLIVGPYDNTDRFTYWPVRVARGGEVMCPGRGERPIQLIDSRDLAEWIVRMIEARGAGVYNANRPPNTLTMQNVLDECKSVAESDALFTWVSEAFLHQEQVLAWSQMPLWLPEEEAPQLAGFMFINCDKALAAGLRIRPVRETVRDTLTWANDQLRDTKLKAGIDPAREATLLSRWHEIELDT
jgi:nucleoside-diphosphate-sugar epimerase